jgi:hypothetical protein
VATGSVRVPHEALEHYRRARPAVAANVAPDLVEAILGGWADQRVMLERLQRPLPVRWEEQRVFARGCS